MPDPIDPTNPEVLGQLFAELSESIGEALGLVVSALAHEMDAAKVAEHLRGQLAAARVTKLAPEISIRMATHALAALDAESAFQRKGTH